jgi:hypothetical protein
MTTFGGFKNQKLNTNLKRVEKNFVEKNKKLASTYRNKPNGSNIVNISNNEVGVVIKCLNEFPSYNRTQLKPIIKVENEKLNKKLNKDLIPTHDSSMSSISSESSIANEVENFNQINNRNLLKNHFAEEVLFNFEAFIYLFI